MDNPIGKIVTPIGCQQSTAFLDQISDNSDRVAMRQEKILACNCGLCSLLGDMQQLSYTGLRPVELQANAPRQSRASD